MRTMQGILAAGIVLAAAVRSFGLPSIIQQPADEAVSVGATVNNVVVARGLAQLQAQNTFTRLTEGPLVTDALQRWVGLWGDYDEDGWLDLVVEGYYWGSGRNTRLYHNEGNGEFTSVTNSPMFNATDRVAYCPWADLDNDGDLDLFVTTWEGQAPFVYLNQGGGRFTRIAAPLDIAVRGSTMSWGDYDADGFLDAFLGNYSPQNPQPGSRNSLLHNNGDGTFAVVTNSAMSTTSSGEETSAWIDYDNDGDLDLFVVRSHLSVPCQVYRNDGEGQFVEATPEPIKSDQIYSISSAWADFDNDGDLDLFHMGFNSTTHFYINQGQGTFSRWAGQPGELTSLVVGSPVWGDYDNDGYLDLFITQRYDAASRSRLYRNLGDGNFEEILGLSPVTEIWQPSHPAWVDYDNDGDLDLFVAGQLAEPNRLYRNDGNTNHWLKVRLKGTISNSHGVGARLHASATIRGNEIQQLRQITAQSVIQELEAHFGLGDASTVETLRVEWPSGQVTQRQGVPADQILTWTEPPIGFEPLIVATSPGSNVNISVLWPNTTPISFQWHFNGTPIEGATSATLQLPIVQYSQTGRYTVEMVDEFQQVLSQPLRLTVYPLIAAQPQSLTVVQDDPATLSVSAASPWLPLTYQWRCNGLPLANETNTTLSILSAQPEQEGLYDVIVTDALTSLVSDTVQLTVLIKPRITQLATNYTLVQGGNLTLSVEAEGTLPITYLWRRNFFVRDRQTNDSHQSFFMLTNVQPSEDRTQNVYYMVTLVNSAVAFPGVQSGRIYLTVLPDSDGDGMDDAWETEHGLDTADPSDAHLDADSDGLTNCQEYQCGTDPIDPNSYLKVERIAVTGEARIEFIASANLTYTVEYTQGLENIVWHKLTDVVAGPENRTVALTDPAGIPQRYYRLITPRQP